MSWNCSATRPLTRVVWGQDGWGQGTRLGQGYPSNPSLLTQGRHKSDRTVNNRPCEMLVGER